MSQIARRLIIAFLFCISLNISTAYGLSTYTTNIIQGNSPELVNTKLVADKYGFTVNGVFYSESLGNIKEDEIKLFDGNLTFDQFVVKLSNENLLDTEINYQDVDGDVIDTIHPFAQTATTYQWYDARGKKIPSSDKNKIIGCGSGYSMPLNLQISLQAQTFSEYGIPKQSDIVPITKNYKIMVEPKICYAKPYQMILFPNAVWASVRSIQDQGKLDCILAGYADNELALSTSDNSKHLVNGWNLDNSRVRNSYCGGGYNANVFDPVNGFKVSVSPHFPTTGFPGAKFQLIMTGHQEDFNYKVSANPQDSVTVDKAGNIKLNKKPVGDVTISAKYKNNNQAPEQIYSFNLTGIWVNPRSNSHTLYTYQQAVNMCGGEANLPSRSEMTNSPNAPTSWTTNPYTWDAFTRTIGDGVLSEWGMTTKETYPDSNWFQGFQWFYTRDQYAEEAGINAGSSNRFSVDAWIGQVQVFKRDTLFNVVCKQ